MGPDVALILKLTPLATQQLNRYRRGNLSKSLDRLVQAELEADPDLGPGVTDALVAEWLQIHNDPRAAVIIAGLLHNGEVAYLGALRIRAIEMLTGLEMLPLDVPDVVARIVKAVANNFVAAQKDEMNASQTGTTAVLSALDRLATREDLGDALQRLERAITPLPPRVILLASSLDEAERRHLEELLSRDPAAAGKLGEVVNARGPKGSVISSAHRPAGRLNCQQHSGALQDGSSRRRAASKRRGRRLFTRLVAPTLMSGPGR